MDSKSIAAFLRNIPQSNQVAKQLIELVPTGNQEMLYGYITLLQTIGIVVIDENQCIKASSQTAKYMLESLASFVEHDLNLVDEWKRRGVYPNEDAGVFQNGATLLYEMEKRRMALLEAPAASRTEEVVQILIKRTNAITGLAELLMQYDTNADQYQLIGGRRSPADLTLQDAAIREIKEEIVDDIQFKKDYDLNLLIPKMMMGSTLSPTFGALTDYHFSIYHMLNLRQDITLDTNDSWVEVDSLLSEDFDINENRIIAKDNQIYRYMDRLIVGGLSNLDDSFSI